MKKFIISKDCVTHIKRFNTQGRKLEFKISTPPPNAEPSSWLRSSIEEIIQYATRGLKSTDQVGITFCGESFKERGPGWLSFRPASEIKLRDIWELISKIFQSNSTDTQSHPRYTENYIEEDKFLPNFVTLGQKYSIAVGSTVVLPCKINETEHSAHYVLAWKRDIAVLTAGSVKVTVNPRIRLMQPHESQSTEPHMSSYNLEIREVRLSDAGDYACQIGSMDPKEIVHTLEVLVPPKINKMHPDTRVDVSKGASIRLECRANGNPPPRIVWSRKNNVMPNGEPNVTSDILEMMHADRHTVGSYQCIADNRVGQPDKKEIYVNVLYAPEIEVERPFVHTGVGHEAQLTCIVHAEPMPHVIWYKDTTQLGTTEQHSQQNHGNRFSLIIRNVTYNDLGNYTCQASNNLGKDRASLSLSGIPTVCVFDSPTLSNYRNQYNISWTVQSYSPIREYRLFYRRQVGQRGHGHHDKVDNNHIGTRYYNPGETTYHRKGLNGVTSSGSIVPGYSSLDNSNSGFMGGGTTTGGGNSLHQEHETWNNIIIPVSYSSYHENGVRHVHSYTGLTGSGLNLGRGPMGGHEVNDENYMDHNSVTGSGVYPNFGLNRNHNIRHRMSYLIKDLIPATNYEARVQARNDHDWNKLSAVFHFSTRAEDMELEPSAQPAVSKTAGVLDKDAFNGSNPTSRIFLLNFSSSSLFNQVICILTVVCTFLFL